VPTGCDPSPRERSAPSALRSALVTPLLALVAATTGGCQSSPGPPTAHVASLREIGRISNPLGASGRDGGFSVPFGGRSVWIFGDTFFAKAAADGYQWRASTWSWTDDTDAPDGLQPWNHGLGADGKPAQLIPHTAAEQAFDDAHNGNPCPAGTDCGARQTAWPEAVVPDAERGALAFYFKENTTQAGPFSFTGAGRAGYFLIQKDIT